MKTLLMTLTLMLATPVFAALVTKAKCKDINEISERFTPEYIAVIDGFDKAGKQVEEVDIEGIVTESTHVKNECKKNQMSQINSVRQQIAGKSKVKHIKSKKMLSPTRANCEEFLALEDRYQPIAAYWVAGHAKAGQASQGEVDEVFLKQPVLELVKICKETPKASFYDTAKNWVKKHI